MCISLQGQFGAVGVVASGYRYHALTLLAWTQVNSADEERSGKHRAGDPTVLGGPAAGPKLDKAVGPLLTEGPSMA